MTEPFTETEMIAGALPPAAPTKPAPRGFDPSCLFLLRLSYVNLFEPVGRPGSPVTRCKGCQQLVPLSEREKHFKSHKRKASEIERGAKTTSRMYPDTETSNSQGGTSNMTATKTQKPLKTMIARDVAVAVLTKAGTPMDMNDIVDAVLKNAKVKELGIPKSTIATQIGRAVGSETPARIIRFGRGQYGAVGVEAPAPVDIPAPAEPVEATDGAAPGDDAKLDETVVDAAKDAAAAKPDPKPSSRRGAKATAK